MTSLTPRLKLINVTGDDVADFEQLNTDRNKLDKSVGFFHCTSTTRPSGDDLFAGLGIYETNTSRYKIYDGTRWEDLKRDYYFKASVSTEPLNLINNGWNGPNFNVQNEDWENILTVGSNNGFIIAPKTGDMFIVGRASVTLTSAGTSGDLRVLTGIWGAETLAAANANNWTIETLLYGSDVTSPGVANGNTAGSSMAGIIKVIAGKAYTMRYFVIAVGATKKLEIYFRTYWEGWYL